MKLTEQKLKKLIAEEIKRLEEESGPDGEHALGKLQEINKFSQMLFETIRRDEELPNWVMDKFANCADELNDIYQYMESERAGL
jgi:hypothetical protein